MLYLVPGKASSEPDQQDLEEPSQFLRSLILGQTSIWGGASGMGGKLVFKKATAADVDLIIQIGTETFQAAFGRDNTPEDMEIYLAANFTHEKIRSQIEDPSATFLLGYEGSRLTAYAMLRAGPAPDSEAGPNPVELVRFYILAELIGLGYGSELMDACLEAARDLGHEAVWLGVWEINQRAIAFYQRWGFNIVGERKFILGDDVQNDFIMARPI